MRRPLAIYGDETAHRRRTGRACRTVASPRPKWTQTGLLLEANDRVRGAPGSASAEKLVEELIRQGGYSGYRLSRLMSLDPLS